MVAGNTTVWTSPFELAEPGTVFLQNRLPQQQSLMFRVTKKSVNNTMFVYILDLPHDRPEFIIKNKTSNINVRYCQDKCPNESYELKSGKKQNYLWTSSNH